MAFFKCALDKITVEQLAVIQAVESLFLEQSMSLTVMSLDPITVHLKATLNDMMVKRLFVDRVPVAAFGYIGKHEGGDLVIQKKDGDKPVKRGRKRASKGDSDIHASNTQEVAE